MLSGLQYEDIIKKALKEDIGTGDITTMSTVPKDKIISGKFIAKQDGVICATEIVKKVFFILDTQVNVEFFVSDGDRVEKGDVIATISGNAHSILTGERVALNFLQHLSGIATKTRLYADLLKEIKAKIADTRKTTPGLRVLEKYAVKTGGGANHRYNLSDGVLIKDNHIAAAGGIANAVLAAKKNAPHMVRIEVEVESIDGVHEALHAGADVIMLDNMDVPLMKKAVEVIGGRALTEASGNMDEKNLLEVAGTGVDIISMGALTHTVKAMDISLKFDK